MARNRRSTSAGQGASRKQFGLDGLRLAVFGIPVANDLKPPRDGRIEVAGECWRKLRQGCVAIAIRTDDVVHFEVRFARCTQPRQQRFLVLLGLDEVVESLENQEVVLVVGDLRLDDPDVTMTIDTEQVDEPAAPHR